MILNQQSDLMTSAPRLVSEQDVTVSIIIDRGSGDARYPQRGIKEAIWVRAEPD